MVLRRLGMYSTFTDEQILDWMIPSELNSLYAVAKLYGYKSWRDR